MSQIMVTSEWTDKIAFRGQAGEFQPVTMDVKTPIGSGLGPTPKQLVLLAMSGCSGMDVVSLLKKNRQDLKTFKIEAEAKTAEVHPMVFTEVKLKYHLNSEVDRVKAKEVVDLSLSKYCAVSAMVARSAKITYEIFCGSELVGSGQAMF